MAWVDYVAAAGAATTAFGVGLAYVQLRDGKNLARETNALAVTTRNIAQAQFVFAIDQTFAPFEETRRAINLERDVDEITVWRYAAAFERVARLIKDGHITLERVNDLYGPRFAKLVTNRDQHYIGFVRRRPDAWEEFIWLFRQLARLRELPELRLENVQSRSVAGQ